MKPERLAEWKKFAQESIPAISRLSDASESERILVTTMLSAILELADALTMERERAKRLQSQIVFERGLVAEATGHSFPPEKKADLDAVLDAVRENRDALASANLRANDAEKICQDLLRALEIARGAR